jgi:CheY-like chemotaxis protein
MFTSLLSYFRKKRIDDLALKMPRDELLRRSRLLIVDDEEPAFLQDLRGAGFAVDHVVDIDKTNMNIIEKPFFDLILLDFGRVGKAFGSDEGLSLLRHIKRVNPSAIVIAYTSKALKIEHADFYRLTDGALAKDAGIQESLERLEDGLRKAHSITNVWQTLLTLCDIKPGSKDDFVLQDIYVRALSNQRKRQT